jgi:hypothetical protein
MAGKSIYVRVHLKTGSQKFHRCGMAFTRVWLLVEDVDAATVKRLKEEQMLDVSETKPDDYVDPAAQAAAPTAPTDPAERLAAIKDAIGTLDKADAALWTATKMPKVPAIAAVTGWEVTQAERDAAWAEINKA